MLAFTQFAVVWTSTQWQLMMEGKPNRVEREWWEDYTSSSSRSSVFLYMWVMELSRERSSIVFACCPNLLSVEFPECLTAVGVYLFAKCEELERIDLRHTSLIRVGCHFARCSRNLIFVELPYCLTTAGDIFFYPAVRSWRVLICGTLRSRWSARLVLQLLLCAPWSPFDCPAVSQKWEMVLHTTAHSCRRLIEEAQHCWVSAIILDQTVVFLRKYICPIPWAR